MMLSRAHIVFIALEIVSFIAVIFAIYFFGPSENQHKLKYAREEKQLEQTDPLVLDDLARCSYKGLYDEITSQCKCFQCQSGPFCLTSVENCVLDATSANPVMYEIYWASLSASSTSNSESNMELDNTYSKLTVPHDWRIGHYQFDNGMKDDKHYSSPELEAAIRSLHNHVENADTENHELVIGVGSTQLTHAALFALEKKIRNAGKINDHSVGIGNTMKVTARSPYYDEHRLSAEFLPGMHWVDWSEIQKTPLKSCAVEIITMPGNPDATMMDHPSSPCDYIVYDHAYYWPQYTPILKKVNDDIMLFTLTKLTGHAGSRIGWAWVKDPEIAQYMRDFINLLNHGVPHESQIRASFLLKHLMKKKGGLIEWATEEMENRWNRLENILEHTNRFKLEKRLGPMHDLFNDKSRIASPAYLWMKCNWKKDLKNADGSCQRFLLNSVNIIGRDGQMYGGKFSLQAICFEIYNLYQSVFQVLANILISL